MSGDPSFQTLLSAAREHDHEDLWLDEIIQKELEAILASMPDRHATSCMLHDLGNYLLRTTTLLARLSDKIVNGDEVHKYCDERILEMEVENDFSDLGSLGYMAEKHTTLKYVVDPALRFTIMYSQRTQIREFETTKDCGGAERRLERQPNTAVPKTAGPSAVRLQRGYCCHRFSFHRKHHNGIFHMAGPAISYRNPALTNWVEWT